jgi:hypothetical protein
MSWTPSIWIKKADFERVMGQLDQLEVCDAWEYSIAGVDGVVLSGGEGSARNRDIHAVIHNAHIPHWLIDGEGAECDDCQTWGEKVMEAYPR